MVTTYGRSVLLTVAVNAAKAVVRWITKVPLIAVWVASSWSLGGSVGWSVASFAMAVTVLMIADA